jgi:hypothetical protein
MGNQIQFRNVLKNDSPRSKPGPISPETQTLQGSQHQTKTKRLWAMWHLSCEWLSQIRCIWNKSASVRPLYSVAENISVLRYGACSDSCRSHCLLELVRKSYETHNTTLLTLTPSFREATQRTQNASACFISPKEVRHFVWDIKLKAGLNVGTSFWSAQVFLSFTQPHGRQKRKLALNNGVNIF